MFLSRAGAFGLLVAGIVGFATPVQAGVFIPGSTLVTEEDLDQLETWLGEGELTLTNIFSAVDSDGKTATDFHAAVDGKGRTFVVLEVKENTALNFDPTSPEYRTYSNPRQIIGGYNPLSWNSVDGYHLNPTNVGRTAFLFNLTNDVKQDQKQDGPGGRGYYQTNNLGSYGPIFGGGWDLYVGNDLTDGGTIEYSYGPGVLEDDIFTDDGYSHSGRMFGTIEVFTIAPLQASSVPEASSLVAWSILIAACGSSCLWRRRRHENLVAG